MQFEVVVESDEYGMDLHYTGENEKTARETFDRLFAAAKDSVETDGIGRVVSIDIIK
jgi:hypothetical protein